MTTKQYYCSTISLSTNLRLLKETTGRKELSQAPDKLLSLNQIGYPWTFQWRVLVTSMGGKFSPLCGLWLVASSVVGVQ